MDLLTSPDYQPFAVAGLVMAGLVLLEMVLMVVGFSLSHVIDTGLGFETDHHHGASSVEGGLLGGVLGWINAGRVPVLVLIIAWLAVFAASGFVIQTLTGSIWAPLPAPIACMIAFLLATPATRSVTRLVSFIIPQDESYVISDNDLIGRVAEVTLGPLDQGPAGRIKVQDPHGNWHFPLARLAQDHAPVPVGSFVLLVDRSGPTFLVIPAPEVLKHAG